MAVPQERLQPVQAQIHADFTEYRDILTPDALAFLARLHQLAEPRRQQLLKARQERQARYDAGALPDYPNTGADFTNWDQPSVRGWFARALWQALNSYFSADQSGSGGYVP